MSNVSSSNSQEANVPELRFPGFSDNWETVALSDFTERVTRKNVNNESNLPLTISSKDGLVDQISYFNKAVASRDMSGYYLLQNGEFAYNKSYSVGYDFGSIKRLDKYPKGALSTLYICFALKKYDSDFIKIYFDSLKWYREICMIAAEGARNHGLLNVSADAFFATKHILPQNEKEQEKIAAFMVLLEKKVVLQQQLVDALKLYKRGALSQLFPKNGASVPEYRFSGFTGDWEQRKLGEVVSVYDGVHQTPKYKKEGIMFLSVENISTLKSEKYISKEAFERDYNIYPEKGDILMTRIGDVGTTNVVETTEKLAFYVSLALLKPHDIDSYYLNNVMRTSEFQKGLRERTLVTAIPQKINKDEIGKVPISMTSNHEEQAKIGCYFRTLDRLITLHQKKVEKYINLKQSMLEKLFI